MLEAEGLGKAMELADLEAPLESQGKLQREKAKQRLRKAQWLDHCASFPPIPSVEDANGVLKMVCVTMPACYHFKHTRTPSVVV